MGHQIKKLPLALKFTPDIPTSSLAVDEYADGRNVEYDVRGIRSVAGDTSVLANLPWDTVPIFITGGFRAQGKYYIIVGGYRTQNIPPGWLQAGVYYMLDTSLPVNDSSAWLNITPPYVDGNYLVPGYDLNTNITASWNGTTVIINDGANAPMFLTEYDTRLSQYSQIATAPTVWNILKITPATEQFSYKLEIGAKNICNISGTTLTITTAIANEFYSGMVLESTASGFISGTTIVSKTSPTVYTVSKSQTVTGATIENNPWPSWVRSDFTSVPWRENTDLVITGSLGGFDDYTWSFYPATQTPYIAYIKVKNAPSGTYISNDTFPPGNLNCKVKAKFIWNYNPNWKSVTANFVRLFNTQNVGSILVAGGLTATGIDSNSTQTKYPTTLQWSQAFGLNSVPLTWEPTITNVANQVEAPVTGTLLDGYQSDGNFYVSTYVDTAVMSPINYTSTSAPILSIRQFNPGRGTYSTNVWVQSDTRVFGMDSRDVWEFSNGEFKSLGNQTTKNFLANAIKSSATNRIFMVNNSAKYQIEIYYPDDTTDNKSRPNKMIAYRYDVGVWNPPRDVSNATNGFESPLLVKNVVGADTYYVPSLSTKVVMYSQGSAPTDTYTGTTQFVIKDVGDGFVKTTTNPTGQIDAYFVKNGIPLAETFNQKSTVFRVYPELAQLGSNYETNRNIQMAPTGSVNVYLNGANSPGTPYITIGDAEAVSIDATDKNPYIQYPPAEYRSHGIQFSGSSTAATPNIWYASAVSIQYNVITEES